jgi:hypothetical protein
VFKAMQSSSKSASMKAPLKKLFQVTDGQRLFQAVCSAGVIGTICMPSFAARCDSACSTRSR